MADQKARGRPPGREQSERLQLRVSPDFLQQIDDWRRTQPELPSRAETIRRLIDVALELENPDGLQNEYRKLAQHFRRLAGRYKGRIQSSDDPEVNDSYELLYIALSDFARDIEDIETREASRPSNLLRRSDD